MSSDVSTETVPTRTGRPILFIFSISLITDLYFSFFVLKTTSGLSILLTGLLVGITITVSLYIFKNSGASVSAVPVMPESLVYILK